MPTRPLPPIIGETENVLRPLLVRALAASAIGGYDEWVYLNIQERADDPAQVDDLVAAALRRPIEDVIDVRTHLTEAGLLSADGALTACGRDELARGRNSVAQTTATLTAGIEPTALQVTIETLEIVRSRAEQLLAG